MDSALSTIASSSPELPELVGNISPPAEPLRDQHLVALHEVIGAVARQTDPRVTLAVIAEKACLLATAASAAISLLDASRTLLDFAAVAGPDAAEIIGQTVRVEDAFAGRTALTGELYLTHNPEAAAGEANSPDPTVTVGVRSAIVVPLFLHGRPAGALTVLNRTDGEAFSGGDLLRLQTLAGLAAQSLRIDELKRQAAQKQQERDILFRAAQTTSSSLNVQEVLGSVLATVVGSMEMTAGAVFLLNDERTRLYVGAARSLADEDLDRQLAAEGPGLAARALSSGQPLRINDAGDDPAEDLPLPGMRSLLIAPMVARSNPEGLLVVGSRQPGAYSAEDASLLSAVASQAAVALENAWLYEDATRRAQEAAALYELSQSVGATLNLNRVIHFVADSVLGLLHVDKFALFLYDPAANCLEIKVSRNLRRETAQTMKPRLGEGIAGWVLEFETPTAVQDVAADHRNRSCPIDGEGVTSLVSVPLQSGEQVIGVLHAMSSRRRLFTVGEMELLYTIANQVGAAIANAQMYHDARQKSEEIRKGVRRIARALGSSLDERQTAQTIVDLALEMTGADRAVLYALAAGSLSARASANFKSPLSALPAISLTEGGRGPETATAYVARRGRSLTIEDFAKDMRFVLPVFAARERITAYLGVPLKLGKDVLGVLEVYTREPRRFTPDEMRLLITFASQASVGLQNALLVEQAGRRLNDLQALDAVSELLARGLPPGEFYPAALRLLGEAAGADAGVVQRFDLPGEAFVYHAETARLDSEDAGRGEEMEALLRDLAGQLGGVRDFRLLPADHAVPTLAVPIPAFADAVAHGALIFLRAPHRSGFNSHERRLAVTAANLLASSLLSESSQESVNEKIVNEKIVTEL